MKTNWKSAFESKASQRVRFWIGFFVLSDFEMKIVQSVRFWNLKKTRQLLNWNFHNAWDFEIKVFQLTDFQKKLRSKNCVSVPFAPWKPLFSHTFAFWKASFWIKNFTTFRTSNQKFSTRQSFCLVEELLQKLQPLCSTYQHVDCLHTLFKYRVSRKFVAKSGERFDNVQRRVYFN